MVAVEEVANNISTVAGRYVLGEEAMHPGVNMYACRLRAISQSSFVAAAPVIAPVGTVISASFGPFGSVRGRIVRHVSDGFAVDLESDRNAHAALGERIVAFRDRNWSGVADKRAEKRFMPAEPRSIIILADGRAMPCLIVDYSASGAAISADIMPANGDAVTIGQITGTVVRRFDCGFAVHFDSQQSADDVEQLLEAPAEWQQAVAVVQPRQINTKDWGEDVEGYGYD